MVQILLQKEKDPYFYVHLFLLLAYKFLILLLFSHCAPEFPLS